MFGRIGSFAARHRLWVISFWVLVTLAMVLFAPSLRKTGSMEETRFLPRGTESLRARELTEAYFPGTQAASNGTLVFFNSAGLNEDNLAYARQVRDWLLSEEALVQVEGVSSIFDSPQLEKILVSPDNTTMLMQVGFSEAAMEAKVMEAVKSIRSYLEGAPPGLEVHVSGEAGISSDFFDALNNSIDRTTIITVALVVVLLLVMYRSPVASLVPLITIGMAYLVARGVLGYIASAGVSIWSQVDAFIVVLIFGVGTDYCLFMVSRFREELRRQESRFQAIVSTVSRIGAAISAAAAAAILGLLGMGVGRFEMTRTMGPVLGLSIFITLIAALTLTPALTSLFGRRLFWPFHEELRQGAAAGSTIWARVARVTTGWPVFTLLVIVAVLLIPYVALPGLQRSFNTLGEVPQDMDSIAGFRVLEGHYGIGEMMPSVALVVSSEGQSLSAPDSLAALARASNALTNLAGVEKVQSVVQPQGLEESGDGLTVSGQLLMLKGGLVSLSEGARTDPGSVFGEAGERSFKGMMDYLRELEGAFPWVTEEASYQALDKAIQDLGAVLNRIKDGTLAFSDASAIEQALQTQLANLGRQLEELSSEFKERGSPYLLPQSLLSIIPEAKELSTLFFSEGAKATRFYIILESYPYSSEAIKTVKEARTVLRSSLRDTSLSGTEMVIGGPTAEASDVQGVMSADFNRVMVVVIAGIFVVLIVLLRSLVAPVYLLLTVLFSYGSTLGIVTWLFQGVMGHEGISYMVPLIVFVLLVALGADYNIFLISRVREESEGRSVREGARLGATATGGVITACGIILAGTFAALGAAPIQTLFQVGVAIAIGILIDTFIVRALLVPAIAAILERWNWWPMARSRSQDT